MMQKTKKQYFIGTSGWDYSHWKGTFYPSDIPKKDWFDHYSKHFDTVEVNYTFYRWPTESLIGKWRDRAPAGFRYTLKAPRTITHVRRLKDVSGKVGEFYRLSSLLGDKSGCHIFQLPPVFVRNDTNLKRLEGFLKSLEPGRDNAIEFRHPSWWDEGVYSLLRTYGTSFCSVNGLGMPEDIVETCNTAYFRFHGRRYDTYYTDTDLQRYAGCMDKLSSRRIYAYFNNDACAYAPKNALDLRGML